MSQTIQILQFKVEPKQYINREKLSDNPAVFQFGHHFLAFLNSSSHRESVCFFEKWRCLSSWFEFWEWKFTKFYQLVCLASLKKTENVWLTKSTKRTSCDNSSSSHCRPISAVIIDQCSKVLNGREHTSPHSALVSRLQEPSKRSTSSDQPLAIVLISAVSLSLSVDKQRAA